MDVESDDVCWICLDDTQGKESFVQPCKCPRKVHPRCLARWQLQQAGKQEETHCRFCNSTLADWKQSLTPETLKPEVQRVQPIMVVYFEGEIHRIPVKQGSNGLKEFTTRIRELFRLPEDVDISLTFGCKEPLSGQHLKLEGIGAFDAAVHCASVAAAERQHKMKSGPAPAGVPGSTVSGAGAHGSPGCAGASASSGLGSSQSAPAALQCTDSSALSHSAAPTTPMGAFPPHGSGLSPSTSGSSLPAFSLSASQQSLSRNTSTNHGSPSPPHSPEPWASDTGAARQDGSSSSSANSSSGGGSGSTSSDGSQGNYMMPAGMHQHPNSYHHQHQYQNHSMAPVTPQQEALPPAHAYRRDRSMHSMPPQQQQPTPFATASSHMQHALLAGGALDIDSLMVPAPATHHAGPPPYGAVPLYHRAPAGYPQDASHPYAATGYPYGSRGNAGAMPMHYPGRPAMSHYTVPPMPPPHVREQAMSPTRHHASHGSGSRVMPVHAPHVPLQQYYSHPMHLPPTPPSIMQLHAQQAQQAAAHHQAFMQSQQQQQLFAANAAMMSDMAPAAMGRGPRAHRMEVDELDTAARTNRRSRRDSAGIARVTDARMPAAVQAGSGAAAAGAMHPHYRMLQQHQQMMQQRQQQEQQQEQQQGMHGAEGEDADSLPVGADEAVAVGSLTGRLKYTLKAFSRKVARSFSLKPNGSGDLLMAHNHHDGLEGYMPGQHGSYQVAGSGGYGREGPHPSMDGPDTLMPSEAAPDAWNIGTSGERCGATATSEVAQHEGGAAAAACTSMPPAMA